MREKEITEKSDGVAGAGGDEEDARGRRSGGGGLGLRHGSGEGVTGVDVWLNEGNE